MKKFRKVFFVLVFGLIIFFFLKSIHTMDAQQAQKELPTISAANDKQSTNLVSNYTNISIQVVATKYMAVEGYAGNQPLLGTRIDGGGALGWTSNGGPTRTINFDKSNDFKGYTFYSHLGKMPEDDIDNGNYISVTIPKSKKAFKVYVKKNYQVQKVAIFGNSTLTPKSKKSYIQSVYITSLIKTETVARPSKKSLN